MSYRSNAVEARDPEPRASQENLDIDLLPPVTLNQPLWKRLVGNLTDALAPEKLPPLLLGSRPLDLGLPLGERLLTPWFRTVFTNLGDVISPEVLPPLELESVPVDVGELVSDQISHMWFGSLLRNLADRLVPERLPKLEMTSKPMDNIVTKTWMFLPAWSEVISTKKVFYPDKPSAETSSVFVSRTSSAAGTPVPYVPPRPPVEAALVRDLRRSRVRSYIWIGVAAAQVVYLIVSIIQP
jgi:hypothetical protein